MRRITRREFNEWQAYDLIDPIGDRRTDQGFALVAFMIASAFAGTGRAPKFEAFVPDWEKRVLGQTPADMRAGILAWVKRHNASKEKRRGRDDRSTGHQVEQ